MFDQKLRKVVKFATGKELRKWRETITAREEKVDVIAEIKRRERRNKRK